MTSSKKLHFCACVFNKQFIYIYDSHIIPLGFLVLYYKQRNYHPEEYRHKEPRDK